MSAPLDVDADEIFDQPIAPDGFSIQTEEQASWAVNTLLTLDEQIDRVKAQHTKVLRLMEGARDRARDFFEAHLRAFLEAHPPAKGKTLHLPHGSLSLRMVPGGPRIDDEAACLEWARRSAPKYIRRIVTERLDSEGVRELYERTAAHIHIARSLAASSQDEKARAELDSQADAMLAELPAGVGYRVDEERLYVRGPKTKGGK